MAQLRIGFSSGDEPAVENLFLLDSQQALEEGRFREAILFSWSTIDATFNIFYERLVDRMLAQDWRQGRDFMKGNDFGLRNKMTVGLKLLVGRSLFDEPDQFWTRLSTSYERRNKIIHEGQTANEEDARTSVAVAEELVETIRRIAKEQNIDLTS